MRLLGFIFILVSLMVGIGSNLSSFIDAPSLIFVIPGALALLVFAGLGVGNMFGAVFSADATSEQLTAAADAWEHTGIYAQAMGGIGTIIGLVIILKNMDDPAALGPGMAVALLTVFYGLFVAYAVALPLQTRLRSRAAG
ncbi:MAG: MotA/TolQ/ExbB proton channel family protein [Candidatus Latescibacterota bacterium]|nr:MotA/TolQ/ExbB proton channel family protein [Candidatus Latescibacterota bacterium]